ncbi:MAG: peptidylprolyl isomerase [Bacteroidales bacterium]|jgi:peptidyl-prolyl cis-trans isomerase B (cyclophilin B)|nr:peptidylprolyl isomerase [Bacteroidales bacterium]MDD2686990.1 peptidylprolyl isomerase [Bacteroidales bacterium]MDD3330345.1 peptidylprolyl isomerase [Bacteroidales bacterium]MDD3690751.1 peptidylprolyl isomerase [Bacteroidales bacterium]MDD4044286.1 peptidylprolyl isomerase [Bacteroidales bacterium]
MRNIYFLILIVSIFALQPFKADTFKKSKKNKEILVKVHTNKGEFIVKLYNETPLHRDNFLRLVNEGYYDSLLFHRVIEGFMIQGGDPDSKNASPGQMLGNGGPNYTIPAEFNSSLIHKKGALAAARTADYINPKKESSGSQFYIVQGRTLDSIQLNNICLKTKQSYTDSQKEIYQNLGGTPHLDGSYTVFGEVIDGLHIIDSIAAVKTNQADRPIEDVRIISMKIVKRYDRKFRKLS